MQGQRWKDEVSARSEMPKLSVCDSIAYRMRKIWVEPYVDPGDILFKCLDR